MVTQSKHARLKVVQLVIISCIHSRNARGNKSNPLWGHCYGAIVPIHKNTDSAPPAFIHAHSTAPSRTVHCWLQVLEHTEGQNGVQEEQASPQGSFQAQAQVLCPIHQQSASRAQPPIRMETTDDDRGVQQSGQTFSLWQVLQGGWCWWGLWHCQPAAAQEGNRAGAHSGVPGKTEWQQVRWVDHAKVQAAQRHMQVEQKRRLRQAKATSKEKKEEQKAEKKAKKGKTASKKTPTTNPPRPRMIEKMTTLLLTKIMYCTVPTMVIYSGTQWHLNLSSVWGGA